MTSFKAALAAGVGTFALIAPDFAFAQGPEVEEMLVTARRREESIQTVPVAISAFKGEDLRRAGVKEL